MMRSLVLLSCVALVLVGCTHAHKTPRADMGMTGSEVSQPMTPSTAVPKDANAILEIASMRTGSVSMGGRMLPYIYFKGIAIEPAQGGGAGAVVVFDAVCGGLGNHGFNITDLTGSPPDLYPSVAWVHNHDSGDVLDVRAGFVHIEILGRATASTGTNPTVPPLPNSLDPARFPRLQMDPAPAAEVQWAGAVRITAPWVPWTITRGKRLATGAVSTSYIHVVVPDAAPSDPPRLERLYGKSDKSVVGKHTDRNPVHEDVLANKFSDWVQLGGVVTPPADKDSLKNTFVSNVQDFVNAVRAAP